MRELSGTSRYSLQHAVAENKLYVASVYKESKQKEDVYDDNLCSVENNSYGYDSLIFIMYASSVVYWGHFTLEQCPD